LVLTVLLIFQQHFESFTEFLHPRSGELRLRINIRFYIRIEIRNEIRIKIGNEIRIKIGIKIRTGAGDG